ncbi:CARDB domain-containing protein [Kribbia dieselivorans]|uniref:CARDB domain-containing protein n=1 Tax=Kribbia dieselivorans TaxID=331526 RepID=UPI0012EDD88E|nr:CARDB domain-containing protein [Kribbia dieselivorans]
MAAPATASASDSQFEQVAASLEPGQLQPGSQGRSVERSAVDAPASAAAATDIQQATIADRTTNNAPSAQQRLTKVVVTRDRAKRTLTAQATFAASPTTSANSLVVVAAGAWNGNTCETRALMIGAAATADAAGSLIDPDLDLAVARTRSGATVTLTSAAHTRIGTEAWNCAYAYNTAPTDINSTYTGFYAEDLAVPKVPKLATSLGAPLQGDYKGTYSKVRVTVRNRGKGDATNVRVRLSGSGLKMLSTSKSLGTIEPNRSASHVFKVRVASGSKRTLTAKATATGGYAHSATTTMVIKPRPKKYASLTGRYFWGFRPDSALYNVGWMTRAVWFVNSTYAYVDFAKNGVKPTCTRTTTKCKRYTYNARTGVATIAGQRVTINTEGFTYKVPGDPTSSYFDPLYLPKKGARVATYLTHKTYHGNCILSCTAFTDRIELGTNGRFVKSSVALGSWPGIGGSWGSIPPDKRGTYRIISTGRIELKYATGTKQRRTIGYMLDLLGRSSPKNDGIMLGNTNYYREWN